MAKRSSGLRLQPAGGTRASSLPVGKKQILSIERLAHDGRGIAHAEGRTWFVSGALPGEQINEAIRTMISDGTWETAVQENLGAAGFTPGKGNPPNPAACAA